MIQIQKINLLVLKVIVTMSNGKKIIEQLDRADAHPYGSRPFKRQNYIQKFLTLTNGILDKKRKFKIFKSCTKFKKLKVRRIK